VIKIKLKKCIFSRSLVINNDTKMADLIPLAWTFIIIT